VSRTLVICKPDAVERGYVGDILNRIERKGLKLVTAELRTLDRDTLARHYEEHVAKPFYDSLVSFMARSPAMVAVVEGPDDTYAIVRGLMGPTNPADAPPGTIRGDLGVELTENLVHGSDSNESAEREIAIFFPALAAG
jgi:nucleoside-diphosphate kinase